MYLPLLLKKNAVYNTMTLELDIHSYSQVYIPFKVKTTEEKGMTHTHTHINTEQYLFNQKAVGCIHVYRNVLLTTR